MIFSKNKMLSLLIVSGMLFLLLVGCVNSNNMSEQESVQGTERQEPAQPKTVVVTDAGGVEVELPAQIDKLACWSATIESAVICMGGADKLLYTNCDDTMGWAFLLYPELADVDNALNKEWNTEALIEAEVDVVLVKNTGNAESLREAGIPALYLDFDTTESMLQSIQVIGQLIDREEEAARCAAAYERYKQLIDERLSNDAMGVAPTVYYNICRYNTPESVLTQTYSADAFCSTWLTGVGCRLIVDSLDLGSGIVEINMEELLAADPDYILVSGTFQKYTYNDLISGNYDGLFSAVDNDHVIHVPQGIYDWGQAGVENILAPIWCAKTLYPDLFADIDMVQITKSFYAEVMGVTLSDQNAMDILNGQTGPSA